MLRKTFIEISNYVYEEGEYAKKSAVNPGYIIRRTRIDKFTGFRRACTRRGLRVKQFTKLKGIYGKWYHKNQFPQDKKYLEETLDGIGYYISFSNRDVTDYGGYIIPYIPADLLRRMAFYDKELVNLGNLHCSYSSPYTNKQRDYTSAKTYKLHVYMEGVGKVNFIVRGKHNTDLWIVEF